MARHRRTHKRTSGDQRRAVATRRDRDAKYDFNQANELQEFREVERETRMRTEVYDDIRMGDYGDEKEIVVKKNRAFSVGPVPGDKFVHHKTNGRKVFLAEELRKPKNVSWGAFRSLVDRVFRNARPGTRFAARRDRREAKELFLANLLDILDEYLHFTVREFTMGRKGQGQRQRTLKRLQFEIATKRSSRDCTVVRDATKDVHVVFPWRTAVVPWDTNISVTWPDYFYPEMLATARRTQFGPQDPPEAPSASELAGLSPSVDHVTATPLMYVPDGLSCGPSFSLLSERDAPEHSFAPWVPPKSFSIVGSTLDAKPLMFDSILPPLTGDSGLSSMMAEAMKFASEFVGDLGRDLLAGIKEWGKELMFLIAELVKLTCVAPDKRERYLVVTLGQIWMVTGERIKQFLQPLVANLLARLEQIGFFAVALATYVAGATVMLAQPTVSCRPLSFADAFDAFTSFTTKVCDVLSPDSVVSATCAIFAAFWSLKNMEDVTEDILPAIFNLAAGRKEKELPKDDVNSLVRTIFQKLPIIASAVTAAILARSLAPLFKKGDTLFEDYVRVSTAAELHLVGTYPNMYYARESEYISAITKLEKRFAEAASAKVVDKIVLQYRGKVASLHADAVDSLRGKLRERPYAVCLVGPSSVGKSNLTQMIFERLHYAKHGEVYPSDRTYVHNPHAAHANGNRNDTIGVVLDDVASAKSVPGVPGVNPTDIIVALVNNISTPCNMADLGSKAKVFWRPEYVIATSNVPDLNAHQYQSCPIAVLGRFNVFVSVEVKPEYRIPGSTALDPNRLPAQDDVPVPDAWQLRVYKYIPNSANTSRGFEIVELLGPDHADVYSLLQFIEADVVRHSRREAEHMQSVREPQHVFFPPARLREMAAAANVPADAVVEHAVELGFREDVVTFWRSDWKSVWINSRLRARMFHFSPFHRPLWRTILLNGTPAVGLAALGYLGMIHFGTPLMRSATMALGTAVAYRYASHAIATTAVAVERTAYRAAAVVAFLVWLAYRKGARRGGNAIVGEPRGVVEMVNPEPMVVPGPVSDAAASTTLGGLTNLAIRASRFFSVRATDGTFLASGVLMAIHTSLYAANKHTFMPAYERLRGEALDMFLCGKIDAHESSHAITFDDVYLVQSDDLIFIRIRGKSEADLRDYIPSRTWFERVKGVGSFPTSESNLAVLRSSAQVKSGLLSPVRQLSTVKLDCYGPLTTAMAMFCGKACLFLANTTLGTPVAGDCGSPLVVRYNAQGGVGVFVVGLLAGVVNENNPRHLYQPLISEVVADADRFFNPPDRVAATQLGFAPLQGMPANLVLVPSRHPYLPMDVPGLELVGTLVNAPGTPNAGANTKSLNTFASRLRHSAFEIAGTDTLDSLLGTTDHEVPPRLRDPTQFINSINRMARSDLPHNPALASATADLQAGWLHHIGTLSPEDLPRPLSVFEGFNGTKDIKPLNLNTAAGFGFRGKKYQHIQAACVRECQDPNCKLVHPSSKDYVVPDRTNYVPNEALSTAISEMEQALRGGSLNCAVFQAQIKDESKPATKSKMRIFFVGSTPFNVLVRMYLGPIFQAISTDRRFSEHAIGMDVSSADWGKLMEALEGYNSTEWLGGDYSNFDNSIPSALVDALAKITLAVAERSGYRQDELQIVAALLANLRKPLYVYLGTVYRADGTNPSGNALTSVFNSAYNSLVHRVAFYTKNAHLVAFASEVDSEGNTHFMRSVVLRTYGDDVIGAVRPIEHVVSITNHDVARAAASLGMVYGAADKAGELPAYYAPSRLRFLKHADVFSPSLGRRIGQIELGSIRKSLKFERSPGLEVARNTATSALRLFYSHCDSASGRERFTHLREFLLAVLASEVTVSREGLLPTFDQLTVSLTQEASVPSSPASVVEMGEMTAEW